VRNDGTRLLSVYADVGPITAPDFFERCRHSLTMTWSAPTTTPNGYSRSPSRADSPGREVAAHFVASRVTQEYPLASMRSAL
jgi:hypothetical protein